ncbi:MAG: magnesium transporter [Gammaproteobacteria bacterium]|jgi:magnesium transporter
MNNNVTSALERTLETDFFARHPIEAATLLDTMSPSLIGPLLSDLETPTLSSLIDTLSPATLVKVLEDLPLDEVVGAISVIAPARVASILRYADETWRDAFLNALDSTFRVDVDLVLSCPPDSAGALMDPRVMFMHRNLRVSEALSRLRGDHRSRRYVRSQRILLVVDNAGKLEGIVAIQDLALADPDETIGEYMQSAPAFVSLNASGEEMVELLTDHALSSLPVVDDDGHLVGVVRYEQLVAAAQENVSVDLQTMFGVSRDEKALSKVSFAVQKRLPWLQINLLTAFLAASVVGIFEETIATYTALAILLPVVAGQSGNTGAQALAVVIRGLALREISSAHWRRVVLKESLVAAMNGAAVALTTALAVYFWSDSLGLTLVIGLAMIISMSIAGSVGAAIPLVLTRLGQDPAQSSSIILTTVTDIAGFFSFLGIATLFITML